MSEKLIYTIGTSNRSIDEFIEILKKYQIKTAIDVRSFPKSARFPHFNSDSLKVALEKRESDMSISERNSVASEKAAMRITLIQKNL